MTYQEYFKQTNFEEIWAILSGFYAEPEDARPLYENLVNEIVALPIEQAHCDKTIKMSLDFQNEIKVEIDSMDSIDIDFCVELSRDIETAFPRDDEDYELEVGSAGLTSPFKVLAQYRKNLGNKVEVLTRDGRKLHGILVEAADDRFAIEMQVKVKREGAKRPVEETQREEFAYSDVKSVCYDLDF